MNLLDVRAMLLGAKWWLLAGAVGVGLAGYLISAHNNKMRAQGRAEVQSKWDAAKLVQERQRADTEAKYRADEATWRARAKETDDAYAENLQLLKKASAARAVPAGIVRDNLSAIGAAAHSAAGAAGAACGPENQRVSGLSSLLQESVGLVEEGAERVERLDAKVTGLQNFVAVTCTGSEPQPSQ